MVRTNGNEENGCFNVHNVGFYNLAPRQIKCLSFNKKTLRLAVSRDDASIEIWDMRNAVFMEKCILGKSSSSVEGLGWLSDRLFSTGQTGELIEWDLIELKLKQKVTLTGNAAWCMDIDELNSCIAVGTHEGYMNTFSVSGNDLNFSKLFDKQEGSILCCKYDSTGNFIVTGSTDTIRIWDVATGHAMYRMATGRSEKNRETNVWSLVVLKDLTIIAGDSRGCITMWNGSNGTRIDSIDALAADVLTVAVNDEETMFCCAGVDPKIHIYESLNSVNQGAPRKWIRNLKKYVHDHDVKALTFMGKNKIVSGGIDGYINVSRPTKLNKTSADAIDTFNDCKFGPFLPQPCAVVAESSRLMLLKHFNYLEVWRLGRPTDTPLTGENTGQRKYLSMHENQMKLVELQSKHREPITCASISPDGKFLIYSTELTVRLFQLDIQTKKPSLTNVRVDSDKFTACAKVLFSSDSKSMYCVKCNGDIEIFSLSYNDEIDIKATISTRAVLKDTISLVCLSKCGQYLACADAGGTLAVWTNDNNRWRHFKSFNHKKFAATAMAIHNKSPKIVVAFSDYKVNEYDLSNDSIFTTARDWESEKGAKFVVSTDTVIKNILLDENNENVVVLQNDSTLFVLEKAQTLTSTTSRKKSKPTSDEAERNYKLKFHRGDYEHFVHLSWLSSNEMVAVTVNPVTLIEQLPPAMRQKLFGSS